MTQRLIYMEINSYNQNSPRNGHWRDKGDADENSRWTGLMKAAGTHHSRPPPTLHSSGASCLAPCLAQPSNTSLLTESIESS